MRLPKLFCTPCTVRTPASPTTAFRPCAVGPGANTRSSARGGGGSAGRSNSRSTARRGAGAARGAGASGAATSSGKTSSGKASSASGCAGSSRQLSGDCTDCQSKLRSAGLPIGCATARLAALPSEIRSVVVRSIRSAVRPLTIGSSTGPRSMPQRSDDGTDCASARRDPAPRSGLGMFTPSGLPDHSCARGTLVSQKTFMRQATWPVPASNASAPARY